MSQIRCLASSDDDTILFVAGGEDSISAKPSIAAVTFDHSMNVVVETEFEFEGLSSVYCLKTFEESNLLFLGTYSNILIVYYKDREFSLIARLPDILPDEVSHLRYIGNALYLASPSKDSVVRVDFPRLAADNRRKSVLGTFSPDFVAGLAKHSIMPVTLSSRPRVTRTRELDGKVYQRTLSSVQDGWNAARVHEDQRWLRFRSARRFV